MPGTTKDWYSALVDFIDYKVGYDNIVNTLSAFIRWILTTPGFAIYGDKFPGYTSLFDAAIDAAEDIATGLFRAMVDRLEGTRYFDWIRPGDLRFLLALCKEIAHWSVENFGGWFQRFIEEFVEKTQGRFPTGADLAAYWKRIAKEVEEKFWEDIPRLVREAMEKSGIGPKAAAKVLELLSAAGIEGAWEMLEASGLPKWPWRYRPR